MFGLKLIKYEQFAPTLGACRDTETHFKWVQILSYLIYRFHPFSAGTVFMHQNLTSVDVRFWCIKTVPALKELKYLLWPQTKNRCIQTTQEELTKKFIMISNGKNLLVSIV